MKKNVSISKPKSNPNHLVSTYTSLRADVGHDINGFGFPPIYKITFTLKNNQHLIIKKLLTMVSATLRYQQNA